MSLATQNNSAPRRAVFSAFMISISVANLARVRSSRRLPAPRRGAARGAGCRPTPSSTIGANLRRIWALSSRCWAGCC